MGDDEKLGDPTIRRGRRFYLVNKHEKTFLTMLDLTPPPKEQLSVIGDR